MKIYSFENFRQLLSYFCVGGTSALVEWFVFSILKILGGLPYLAATALAFLVSTTTNWLLGRTFTFRASANRHRKTKEAGMVFLVSAIGLAFNMLLMYMFVEIVGMDTNLLMIVAKVIATGIVFLWNFFLRKLWIYNQ